MNSIEYPSKRFIKNGKKLVTSGVTFNVHIKGTKKLETYNLAKIFLSDKDEKVESVWDIVQIFNGLFRFLVVHFFALANGYFVKNNFEDGVATYSKKGKAVNSTPKCTAL